MNDQQARQLRFASFLQIAAAVMFGIAFVVRVVVSGLDMIALLFLLLAVGDGVAAVVLRRKANGG